MIDEQSGKEDTTQMTIAILMVSRVNVLTDLLGIVKNPGSKGALRENAYACRLEISRMKKKKILGKPLRLFTRVCVTHPKIPG